MARGHHSSSAPSGSRRQSRVGEIMLYAITAPTLLLLSAPASAEVCDKAVGDNWRPEDGPVWIFSAPSFSHLLILAAAIAILTVPKVWWLGYAMSGFYILGGLLLVFVDLVPQHEMYRAQVEEGCRSIPADLMTLGIALILSVGFAWLGYRAKIRATRQTSLT